MKNPPCWYSVLSNQLISLNPKKEAKEVISIYIIILYILDIEFSLHGVHVHFSCRLLSTEYFLGVRRDALPASPSRIPSLVNMF